MAAPVGLRRLRNVVDPSRIEYGIASSVVVGALSLIDPARLSPARRLAFRGVTAGLVGSLVLLELKRTPGLAGNPLAVGGAATGVAGTVFGLSELSENLDARLMRALDRAGIRRPRVLVAALSTLTSLAAFRSGIATGIEDEHDGANEPFYTPVDPSIRDLIRGMLGATTEYGSAALSAQWATAQNERWSPPEPDGFDQWLEFLVDESTPRVVPHAFTFPVKAQFRVPSGALAEASLVVSDGRLRSLMIDVVPGTEELADFDGGDPLESLRSWPAIEDVTFVLDTP